MLQKIAGRVACTAKATQRNNNRNVKALLRRTAQINSASLRWFACMFAYN